MLERRSRVDVGVHLRRGLEFLTRMPARNADHLHHVFDTFLAQTIRVHRLIGQGQLVIEHIKVAHRGVDILRLHRIAAGKVDAVEILRQLQQVATHLAGACHLLANRHIRAIVIDRRVPWHLLDDRGATTGLGTCTATTTGSAFRLFGHGYLLRCSR